MTSCSLEPRTLAPWNPGPGAPSPGAPNAGAVRQVITEDMGEKYLAMKLKDQERAIALLADDAQLRSLRQVQAPLLDLEVRGLPALGYFGGQMWRDVLPQMAAGAAPGGAPVPPVP